MLHIFLNKGIKDDIYYWSELNKVDQSLLPVKKDMSRIGFDQYWWRFPIKHSLGL